MKTSKPFLFKLALIFGINAGLMPANAANFVEISVDPSSTAEADKITYLLNRDNIAHVEIRTTKTPEREWHQLNFHTAQKQGTENSNGILFKLECNDSKVVNKIIDAVSIGSQKPVKATEVCRKMD